LFCKLNYRFIFAALLIIKIKKMKNLFLTGVLAIATLAASAQFMVVTSYDSDQEENIDKITANLGFGYQVMDKVIVGLTMQDATMNTAAIAGVTGVTGVVAVDAVDATFDANGVELTPAVPAVDEVLAVEEVLAVDEIENGTVVSEMQFFARYNYTENIFLQLTSPWGVEDNIVEGATDFARIGAGYTMNVWGDINAEANYSMLVKAGGVDGDDRKGKLSLGVSMNF
jgi:hypothetical protein